MELANHSRFMENILLPDVVKMIFTRVYQVRYGSELYNNLPLNFTYNSEGTCDYTDFSTAFDAYMEAIKNNLDNVVLTETPLLQEDDWDFIWEEHENPPSYPEVKVLMRNENN